MKDWQPLVYLSFIQPRAHTLTRYIAGVRGPILYQWPHRRSLPFLSLPGFQEAGHRRDTPLPPLYLPLNKLLPGKCQHLPSGHTSAPIMIFKPPISFVSKSLISLFGEICSFCISFGFFSPLILGRWGTGSGCLTHFLFMFSRRTTTWINNQKTGMNPRVWRHTQSVFHSHHPFL